LSELAQNVKAAAAQASFGQGYYAEVLGEFAEMEALVTVCSSCPPFRARRLFHLASLVRLDA
jgi:hypothetical protein